MDAGSGVSSAPAERGTELAEVLREAESHRPPEPPPAPASPGSAGDDPEQEVVHRVSDMIAAGQGAPAGEQADLLKSLTAEDVADFLELAFGLVAYRRGDHWKLSPEESKRIGAWVRKAIERHGIEWVARWLPDIMAGALLGYAILKRVDKDRAIAAEKKLKAADKPADRKDASGATHTG